MRPGLFLSHVTLSDGRQIELADNSILVITGPNNSKSTLLREISHAVSRQNDPGKPSGKVAKNLLVTSKEDVESFESYVRERLHRQISPDYA